jgi:hypothetical protein
MVEKKKSFSDLLSEAPLASKEDTVSLVGAISRSSQAGKFVLSTSQGNVTLPVDAVKNYEVLGGGVGQVLVQVDVDRKHVPESASSQNVATAHTVIEKLPILDKHPVQDKLPITDVKHPIQDIKHPVLDKYPWEEPISVTPPPGSTVEAGGGLAPFALATQQQAPASSLAAMQGAVTPYGLPITGVRDLKHPVTDKRPWLDATGRPPFLD